MPGRIVIKGKRKSKYNAKRTVVDGVTFDSKKEAEYYRHLLQLVKCGEIKRLELQPEIELNASNGKKVCSYFCDFLYWSNKERNWIYVDVKGVKTAMYRLKKKWVEIQYGIKITEI